MQHVRNPQGTILALAYRPKTGDAMIEIDRADVSIGQGLELEPAHKGKRGVTLLSRQSWNDVCRELKADIPWHTRRANVLIDGLDLRSLVGHTLQIGDVRLQVHGETKPCALMDKLHPGLRGALVPEFRGGVHAEVITGGSIVVGRLVDVERRLTTPP
jgi:MOSC domain-containing protein YiiM